MEVSSFLQEGSPETLEILQKAREDAPRELRMVIQSLVNTSRSAL